MILLEVPIQQVCLILSTFYSCGCIVRGPSTLLRAYNAVKTALEPDLCNIYFIMYKIQEYHYDTAIAADQIIRERWYLTRTRKEHK